jgi:hypothetical protein
MRQTRVAPQHKVLLSLFILLVIGLHGLPLVFRKGPSQMSWPFLLWTMYKDSRPSGPIEARETRLMGVTSAGNPQVLTIDILGLPKPTIQKLYIKRMRAGDSSAAQQLFRRINAHSPEPFVEIRIESIMYRLTDSGVVVGENPVLTFRADSSHLN